MTAGAVYLRSLGTGGDVYGGCYPRAFLEETAAGIWRWRGEGCTVFAY